MTGLTINTHRQESESTVFAGALPLDSTVYVERSPIETECYKAILKPGTLIRIKGSQQTGKTSLLIRILHQGTQHGYQTVVLNLKEVEAAILQDLDRLLKWFCVQITRALQLPDRLDDYWDTLFGSTISCKSYFEEYLLVQTPQPLVLALDDVDRLFAYPDVADEFFGLLRAWHEEAKNRQVWQRLRLVVAHSTEVYIPLNIHKSPFNVGVPVELNGLSPAQIQDLARRYGFTWSAQSIAALTTLVGGHPYLVQLTLHFLKEQDLREKAGKPDKPSAPDNASLDKLLQSSSMHPIYQDHLQQQWQAVEQTPGLLTAFAQVIQSAAPVELELTQALKLQSLGLITLRGAQATPSCTLYVRYFGDRLN